MGKCLLISVKKFSIICRELFEYNSGRRQKVKKKKKNIITSKTERQKEVGSCSLL